MMKRDTNQILLCNITDAIEEIIFFLKEWRVIKPITISNEKYLRAVHCACGTHQ